VRIDGANGYLIDQFNQDTCNKRTDDYGGSVENRARFVKEVVAAITGAIGQERTALRLSPWSKFQDMQMRNPLEVSSLSLSIARGKRRWLIRFACRSSVL
jgi:NADPH2 dehydrogenase